MKNENHELLTWTAIIQNKLSKINNIYFDDTDLSTKQENVKRLIKYIIEDCYTIIEQLDAETT